MMTGVVKCGLIWVLLSAVNVGAQESVAQRVAWLNQAEKKLDSGDAAGAMALLKEPLMEFPEDPYLLYNYGITAYAAGELKLAEASWNSVALLNESMLTDRTFFQLGNVLFRQAFEMPTSQKNWDKILILYRRADENYRQVQPQDNAVQKNRAATTEHLAATYLARGNFYLDQARKEKKSIEAMEKKTTWKVNDALDRLLEVAGKAKIDFQDLETLVSDSVAAVQGQMEVKRLQEVGFFEKAQALRKEADEAGSTQNEIWTVQKYQNAITFFEEVLRVNPTHERAEKGIAEVKMAARDLYLKEAQLEWAQATRILNKRTQEQALAQTIESLKKEEGVEALQQVADLETSLRSLKSRYPLSDPEDAIQCLENALNDCQTALSFIPNDPTVDAQKKKLFDETFQVQTAVAEQYMETSKSLPFANDEDADKVVGLQELALKNLRAAQKMKPTEGLALQVREAETQKRLARSYVRRAELYTTMGLEKKELHLDRAVAYFEKAGQDYLFALRVDPLLAEVKEARERLQTDLSSLRLELSQSVAAMYEAEEFTEETGELDIEIDEDYLREMTLQNDGNEKGSSHTYETIERPEPVFNW
jgi:hypothetical protein